jgi:ribosome biogenesis GTPase / thiamine phosphate phosphatase
VRARDGRGRHTTVHRALLCLPWGACLIDSPGLREIKLTGQEDLDAESFADIAELALRCKFSDCQHASEPGCAVQAAVAAAALSADRLASYKKLSAEQAQAKARAAAHSTRHR